MSPPSPPWSRLSGLVPTVGITSGYCFAGNAALLGCCDVIIATANSNIGMGGPAMIEGGGLGVFRPDEIGPMDVQVPNGVVDIAVEDEAEAVEAAKKYLSYFQGSVKDWEAPDDQRKMRSIVIPGEPPPHLRHSRGDRDPRRCRTPSRDCASTSASAWSPPSSASKAGRSASSPTTPSTSPAPSTATARTRPPASCSSCDAFDIPLLSLVDTPGMMVGPEVEKTALVRHCCRLFNIGANLTVPIFSIIVRKSYGLGATAMIGGGSREPFFTVTYPTAEFGGMGLEGQIKLGYRKELAAIEDINERRETYEKMVTKAYEHGKAINTASFFEVDDVIDPAESRHWIGTALRSIPAPLPRDHKKRPSIDTW